MHGTVRSAQMQIVGSDGPGAADGDPDGGDDDGRSAVEASMTRCTVGALAPSGITHAPLPRGSFFCEGGGRIFDSAPAADAGRVVVDPGVSTFIRFTSEKRLLTPCPALDSVLGLTFCFSTHLSAAA